MKKLTVIIASLMLIAAPVTFTSCDKNMTIQERMDIRKGEFLFRWEMLAYITMKNGKKDTVWAKDVPCLRDDEIVFYPNQAGYVLQGSCINYPGKDASVPFRWELTDMMKMKLTSWKTWVVNGVSQMEEGSNIIDANAAGEKLYITETYPVYQEWIYGKKHD